MSTALLELTLTSVHPVVPAYPSFAKKEEKTTDEKPSLLGRLKEKQEQLSSGAKKDAPAQSKKSERDMQ